MAIKSSYVAGYYALEIEGVDAGFVTSVVGGEAFGVVATDPPVDAMVGKHLIGVGYAPITFEAILAATGPLTQWVSAMLDDSQKPKDGVVVFLDYALKERLRLEFTSALITEVTFPAADGAAKDAAQFTVTIQPESTQFVAGSNATRPSTGSKVQKSASRSNFRLTISGLTGSGTAAAGLPVIDVSSIIVKRIGLADNTGRSRPGLDEHILEVSNVDFSVPEAQVAPFAAWFEDFVIKGNAGAIQERTATLAFLDTALKNELARINLGGLGIIRCARQRRESAGGVQFVARIEMYCETVRLAAGSAPRNAMPGTEQAGERGEAAGRKWAAQYATADELDAMTTLAERKNWSVIALPEGHSLIGFLASTGDIPIERAGPLDLQRDDFVVGLVTGAAEAGAATENWRRGSPR